MNINIHIKQSYKIAYTICFIMLIVFVIKPDYSNINLLWLNYFETFVHLLVVVGALFYIFDLSNKSIRKYWKPVPIVYSLYLLIILAYQIIIEHSYGLMIDIIAATIIVLINLPIIIFNYRFSFLSNKDGALNSVSGLTSLKRKESSKYYSPDASRSNGM